MEWIEDGKEFEFNGKLYDVSKIEGTANGFQVYCVNDSLEESFIAMFDQWKKSNSPGNKVKTIFQPQICNRLDVEIVEFLSSVTIEFHFKSSNYEQPVGLAPSPPPKFHS